MRLNKYLLLAFAVFASLAFFACDDDTSINVIEGEVNEEPDEGDDGDDNGDTASVYGITVDVGDDETFTFLVDISGFDDFDPEENSIYITGEPFEWPEPGSDTDLVLVPVEDDQMPESSGITVDAGEVEYKYFSDAIDAGWDGGEWDGEPNRSTTIEAGEVQEDEFGVQPE
ncbi:MAG: hypothetical protein R6V27_15010 [Balneolaceae bacterium]